MNEEKLRILASGLDYPPTPDIAGRVMARLRPPTRSRFSFKALAWSLTIILVLFVSLMLIPPVRAAIIEFIQIGAVRIFPPEPTTQPITTATPESQTTRTATVSASDLLPTLAQMAGRTSLADAQSQVDYPILLPTYPSDLGEPDLVYLQNMDGNMVILVWLDEQDPKKILMSLHFVPNGSWAIKKMEPAAIDKTSVKGSRAIWTTGPYPLYINGDIEYKRLITGHVLIWGNVDVTYRLETGVSMEEALKTAESLEPIK
ncbi:MAG: hypothetical protein QM730_25445 [Anaerolineales bacterium]